MLRLLAEEARARAVEVLRIDSEEVRRHFADAGLTKQDRALALVERFPELLPRLPAKRRPWKSQDERMAIFSAASLVLVADLKTATIGS